MNGDSVRVSKVLTGWITPSREFIPCDLFGHLAALLEHPELVKGVPQFDELWQGIENVKRGCAERGARDGDVHAEWHVVEYARDSATYEAMVALYDNGFVRVGTRATTLYFEGRPAALKGLYQFLKDFAENFDMGCVFEPFKKRVPPEECDDYVSPKEDGFIDDEVR